MKSRRIDVKGDDRRRSVRKKKKYSHHNHQLVIRSIGQQLPSWFTHLRPKQPSWVGRKAPNDHNRVAPYVLLLMGFPGSGKTTFSKKLEKIMPWKYERVNQDDLGSRGACLEHANRILKEGKCPIIDRVHATFQNRKPFYKLAQEHKYPVDCLVFEVPREVCVRRCKNRNNHPTLPPNQAERIIGFVVKDWQLPNSNERLRNYWRVSGINDDLREIVDRYFIA